MSIANTPGRPTSAAERARRGRAGRRPRSSRSACTSGTGSRRRSSPSRRRTRRDRSRATGTRDAVAAAPGRSPPASPGGGRRTPERAVPARAARRAGAVRPPSARTRLERPLDLPVGLALGEVAALVAELLAARERELDLRAPVLEVQARRHERQPLLLHAAAETVDLAPVQEQLAIAVGIVVPDTPLVVGGDA